MTHSHSGKAFQYYNKIWARNLYFARLHFRWEGRSWPCLSTIHNCQMDFAVRRHSWGMETSPTRTDKWDRHNRVALNRCTGKGNLDYIVDYNGSSYVSCTRLIYFLEIEITFLKLLSKSSHNEAIWDYFLRKRLIKTSKCYKYILERHPRSNPTGIMINPLFKTDRLG